MAPGGLELGSETDVEALIEVLELQIAAEIASERDPSERGPRVEDRAVAVARDFLAAAEEAGNTVAQAVAHRAIASVLRKKELQTGTLMPQKAQELLDSADKAVTLFRSAAAKTDGDASTKLQRGLAAALVDLAHARLRSLKAAEGLKAAEEAITLCRAMGRARGLVLALEMAMECHTAMRKPLHGIAAINRELTSLRKQRKAQEERGAAPTFGLADEASLLELLTRTHGALDEPLGALRSASEALEIYRQLGNKEAECDSLLCVSMLQKSLGEIPDATSAAEKALALARSLGDTDRESRALSAVSGLLLGLEPTLRAPPPKAQGLQALKDLVSAVQRRDAAAASLAEERLNRFSSSLADSDITEALAPMVNRDPGARDFLEKQGWKIQRPADSSGVRMRAFSHHYFYLHMIGTGMNFGPQFRVVHPHRTTTASGELLALSVNQLPPTEEYQEQLLYRPGIIDAGLQSGLMFTFPENGI